MALCAKKPSLDTEIIFNGLKQCEGTIANLINECLILLYPDIFSMQLHPIVAALRSYHCKRGGLYCDQLLRGAYQVFTAHVLTQY